LTADATEPAAPQSSAGQQVYWTIALFIAAIVTGWGLANGPEALRRPVLTPLALGLLFGTAVRQLLAKNSPSRGKARRCLAAGLAVGALAVMHAGVFRRIEQAAEVNVREHPEQAQALAFSEELTRDDPAAADRVRQLRLGVAPTIRDYLSHRSAALVGERSWPGPALLLAGEFVLTAVAAGLAWGRYSTCPS
jgi:hypothetical protein